MAREGLAETRQALSALRGDMSPVEDYLRELARPEDAGDRGGGGAAAADRRGLAGGTRVAQEALTNARKHAPGARCSCGSRTRRTK